MTELSKKINSNQVEQAMTMAVDFLYRHQLPYGEFKSYMSPDDQMQEECVFDSSPFVTSLILYSLGFVEGAKVEEMKAKVLEFLTNEMEFPGIWRYWSSYNAQHHVIPPDLDDICCISHAFEEHRIPFRNNKKLILANRNKQGLFYTWLVPRWTTQLNPSYWFVVLREALSFITLYHFWQKTEAEPDDIDGIVNANVLLYLGECEATKPVIDYLIGIIEQGKEDCCDKWHLNRFTFYYMLSRAYFNGAITLVVVKEEIIQRLTHLSAQNGAIGNAMETAMAVCTLLNFDSQSPILAQAITYLLDRQAPSGEWPKFVLYYGGPKKVYGWGSEELSTGFCLEALARFHKKQLSEGKTLQISNQSFSYSPINHKEKNKLGSLCVV